MCCLFVRKTTEPRKTRAPKQWLGTGLAGTGLCAAGEHASTRGLCGHRCLLPSFLFSLLTSCVLDKHARCTPVPWSRYPHWERGRHISLVAAAGSGGDGGLAAMLLCWWMEETVNAAASPLFFLGVLTMPFLSSQALGHGVSGLASWSYCLRCWFEHKRLDRGGLDGQQQQQHHHRGNGRRRTKECGLAP